MSSPLPAIAQQPPYPVTKAVPVTDDYHGRKIVDPYRWLENLNGAETASWVTAQNAVSSQYLGALPGRDAIKRRITELYDYARVTTPYFEGGRWFYSRNSGLQRQNVMYVRTALDAPEQVILDPNSFSADGSIALSGFAPSPDGKHFAYGQSEGGSDWSTYYVRDIASGSNTADTIRWVKFSGLSWTHDGKGFFYSRYPEPKPGDALQGALRDQRLYYHLLGTPQSQDRLIYERPDIPTLFLGGSLDESGRYLFVSTYRGADNKNELLVADLGGAMRPDVAAKVRPLYMHHEAAHDVLGVVNGTLYLSTDRGAPRRRIVAASLADPAPAKWRTIVPEGRNRIESASIVGGRLYVNALEDAASAIRIYSLEGTPAGTMTLPGLGAAGGPYGRMDRPEVFFDFTSPLYPTTTFRFDAKTASSVAWNAPKLNFDPAKFETKRVFYTSRDDTRVPMFITHRKGLALNGANPTMLYAYGGFDISILPAFGAHIPAWLEMGGVWATANIRGGGEYGEAWHEAGMFEKKQNVFDDFIAAGEYLVKEKYTSPRHLGIQGGSNGGLLIGAVMEQRPDLFGVALPAVGVMDMLRYHKFTGGAAWATEYGSADDPKSFEYLARYSPLHNVKQGVCYPATLVTTADHDDRVVPSHSFKFTAAMQEAQSKVPNCASPVLIRVETQGSHGYRPTDKRIAELADQWAFAAKFLGVTSSAITP